MKIIEYRYITVDDPFNHLNYGMEHYWSRPYEYHAAEQLIATRRPNNLHNTACGVEPINDVFKWRVGMLAPEFAIHTDIIPLTRYHNLLKRSREFANTFDIVLNISVLEHVDRASQRIMLENLFDMVIEGGVLFLTVDVPGAYVEDINDFVGAEPAEDKAERIHTMNTLVKYDRPYGDLSVLKLVLQK